MNLYSDLYDYKNPKSVANFISASSSESSPSYQKAPQAAINLRKEAVEPALAAASATPEKKEGYGDTADWVAAAANLVSDMERERQAKQIALMQQQMESANYGLNAMNAAGSALERLNSARRGTYGLNAMAGVA